MEEGSFTTRKCLSASFKANGVKFGIDNISWLAKVDQQVPQLIKKQTHLQHFLQSSFVDNCHGFRVFVLVVLISE